MSRTALVIAPRPATRRTIARAIEHHGAETLEADGPAAARKLAEERPVDIVVLDLYDLEEDGLLLIPVLRRARPRMHIILLTGPEQVPLAIRGMRLGARDEVTLPLDVEELASKVAAALDASSGTGPEDSPRAPTRTRRAE